MRMFIAGASARSSVSRAGWADRAAGHGGDAHFATNRATVASVTGSAFERR